MWCGHGGIFKNKYYKSKYSKFIIHEKLIVGYATVYIWTRAELTSPYWYC